MPLAVVFLLAFYLGKPPLLRATTTFSCGDMNADGTLAAGDALLLLKYAVGFDVTLHCPPTVPPSSTTTLPNPGGTRPNFVLIVTDDQSANTLPFLPAIHGELSVHGTTFEQFFITTPWCCPSRASILRGQYAHNHRIYHNQPPGGGFDKFRSLGHESSTIATWMHDAGYRTAMIGKYLNHYYEGDPDHVPQGWDDWFAALKCSNQGYFDCLFNDNGAIREFGSDTDDYRTDLEADRLLEFVAAAHEDGEPFFALVAPYAPHPPAEPAPRHKNTIPTDTVQPRLPSLNEADTSDKPELVSRLPVLDDETLATYDLIYRRRLETMMAVDEMVAALVAELDARGILDNTYIFFTTDNGFHLGEHRLPAGKSFAYEEDVRFPLIVRGPGVPSARAVQALAANIDLAPTIADLAGVAVPDFVNGRSLAPWLANEAVEEWRESILLEFWWATPQLENPNIKYLGTRRAHDKYVVWARGDAEFYDLTRDPYELDNRASLLLQPEASVLDLQLRALSQCGPRSCAAMEDSEAER